MSFVFQIDTGFLLLDSKPRQGLYHQLYTKEGFSKPFTLLPYSISKYSATLDSNQTLHVVAENNKNQIFYITYDKGQVSRRVILEDSKQLYHFNDLQLFLTSEGSYILYTVKHPTGNSRSLMWQSISETTSTIQTLISYIPDGCHVKFFPTSDMLYIVYTDFAEVYALKLIQFSPLGSNTDTLLTSHIPIIDYNLCQTPSGMHLVIQKDAYGQQQLSHFNLQTHREQLLPVQAPINHPCIFSYCNFLWISYMSGDTLYVLLSDQDHMQFSVPVPCSLQGHISSHTYIPKPDSALNASVMPIQMGHHLRLAVVSSFDISGLHPDIPLSTELDLLFDAIGLTYIPSTTSTTAYTFSPPQSAIAPPPINPIPTQPIATPDPLMNAPYSPSHLTAPPVVPTADLPPNTSYTFSYPPPPAITPLADSQEGMAQSPSHLSAPPYATNSSPTELSPHFSTESIVPPVTLNPTPPPPPKPDNSLSSATRAFMDSSHSFELPPSSKNT